jgi:rhodanese-related sulfurtransferase
MQLPFQPERLRMTSSPVRGPIRDLGVSEIRAGLADGSITLVDVREPQEVANGVIPGSISMPLSRFQPSALPVKDGRQLVFSCAAGVRSRIAVEACRAAGLDVDAHFAPGFKGWLAAGGEVAPLSS